MGDRGPAPTPTRTLELRGSWRAGTRTGEPRPEAGAPPVPQGLSAEAAGVWEEIVPMLEAAGMLSVVDGRALGRYCEMVTVYDDLLAFLRKSGHAHPVKDRQGNVVGVKPYPQLRLALQVSEHLLRLEQRFGMTPAARARLVAEPQARALPGSEYFRPLGTTG
ncbi:MAG: phage terminase small subunit P27 family [Gemmatimonadota bacterium]|jgi:P27 family predicted phage terminase small subunit